MTTTVTVTKTTKTNRRIGYEKRVAEFIANHGPDFSHVGTDYTDADGTDCACCGKRNIHMLYKVQNVKGEQFIIGCECQLFVLGVEKAELNANFIRNLPKAQLLRLAVALGISEKEANRMNMAEMQKETLRKRRHLANKRAWVARKAQAAAAVQATP